MSRKISLYPNQIKLLRDIELELEKYNRVLLYGIPGSGKTIIGIALIIVSAELLTQLLLYVPSLARQLNVQISSPEVIDELMLSKSTVSSDAKFPETLPVSFKVPFTYHL